MNVGKYVLLSLVLALCTTLESKNLEGKDNFLKCSSTTLKTSVMHACDT